jgi:hypothetical protein
VARGRTLFLLLVLAAAPLAAADTLTLDLAKQAPGSSVTVPAGASPAIQFRIVSRLPEAAYSYSLEETIAEIPPFPPVTAGFRARDMACEALFEKSKSLPAASDEDAVAALVDEIEKALAAKECTDPQFVGAIQVNLARTRFDVPGVYQVGPGRTLTLTVSREAGGDKKLSWVLIVSGGERGKWLVTYGVAVAPDEDERYYTSPTSDGKFAILPETPSDGLKAIPAVFFSWLPRSHQTRDWSVSPSAGLGVKDDRPAVFLGASLTYNWNLAVAAGAVLVQETRLNGKYQATDPPQVVAENLSEDQLLSKTYRVRWFAAVTFRFGSNPFGSSQPGGR